MNRLARSQVSAERLAGVDDGLVAGMQAMPSAITPSRAGLWPWRRHSRPGPRQGVTATPSEPWDGAVTVAGDKGVILPVAGLIANCDRAPLPSLVT